MSKIQTIAGRGIPLTGNDIDTDRIIPARYLRAVTFDGLGEAVFIDDRKGGGHPFDVPQFAGASILVVNRNFGCGSSREHAPQALARWGVRAVVGESFAEIFLGNCLAIGVPCLSSDPEAVIALQRSLREAPTTEIVVDVDRLEIHYGSTVIRGAMGAGPRQMFLTGTWDACAQLLAGVERIRTTAGGLPYLHWATADPSQVY